MPRTSKADFLKRWKRLWETVLTLRTTKTAWSGAAREAFELFGAALVYQRNSLAAFTDDVLHDRLGASHTAAPSTDLFIADPLFEKFLPVEGNKGLAQIQLASASFRLGTAFEKAAQPMMGRKAASGYFDGVKKLACCKGVELNEAHAVVIMLVHRDDFGHGEEGDNGEYKKKRQGVLDVTHVCRIIQAQQLLVELGLTKLK